MNIDPIEAFQIATTYIAEGDYAGALPYMKAAAEVMAGYDEFDALFRSVKAKSQ